MDQLRVGLIGCGNISHGHVRNLLSAGEVAITGLAEPSDEHVTALQRAAPGLGGVATFPSAAELLEAVALEAVVIMTPHALHYEHVMLALDRGLHVLCEKPLACSPHEAREIARRAEGAGLVVTVNYQRRLDPAYLRLRRAVAEGELGELRTINMLWGQNWGPLTSGSWRQNPELSGGGMLFDSGSHLLDVLLWLVGSRPETVMALVDRLGTPVDINSVATVRFANGVLGQLTSNGDAPVPWIETVVVTGKQGVMRYEFEPQYPWRSGRLFWYRDGEVTQPVLPTTASSIDNAWVQCIRAQAPNPAPPEAGVQVADLTAAIYRSASEGGVVVLGQ